MTRKQVHDDVKEEWRCQKMMDFEGWNALHL
jgi:hypothetical protein